MRWSAERINQITKLRQNGLTYKDVARMLGVNPASIKTMASRKGLILPKEISEGFKRQSIKFSHRQNVAKRYNEFRTKYENSYEAGYLAGLLHIGNKCNFADGIYLNSTDFELSANFIRIAKRVTKNRLRIYKLKFLGIEEFKYTMIHIYDVALAKLIKDVGERFLSKWRSHSIKENLLDYYKGILQGVFDARATITKGQRDEKAVRLYLEKLPKGAAHNIRAVLKRFGIRYVCQGRLSKGELDFYKSMEHKLRHLLKRGYPSSRGTKLRKKLFTRDYQRRRYITSTTPAIKILNAPDNLRRFAEIINFRRGDLKRKFVELKNSKNLLTI